jgi:thiol-disulfide isomerase/thioredoxin
MVSLSDLSSEVGTLVLFICNHCPFVKHMKDELIARGREYQEKGISVIAISSNDVETYPADAPDLMTKEGYPFPYLYDETQEVAKAYRAACTPDFFLFDGSLSLVYRGQLDDSRPDNGIPVTGSDLRGALNALIAGAAIPTDQKPSLGCNIKWK